MLQIKIIAVFQIVTLQIKISTITIGNSVAYNEKHLRGTYRRLYYRTFGLLTKYVISAIFIKTIAM